MAIKYICCVCEEDVTAQVLTACTQGPETRAAFTATTTVFKGKTLLDASDSVFVTCSKGHQCEYPCLDGSGE